MYPDQQPPNYSIDYLNQIAPQAPKKQLFSRRMLIIVVAVAGLLLIIGLLIFNAVAADNTKKPVLQFAARLQGTEAIVTKAQSKLKSTDLRTLNSNLKIYLTNTNQAIAAPLLKQDIVVAKLDKKLLASEAGADITDRLEDARLNATYDRTYTREIAFQLATLSALMRQIEASTKNKDLKAVLDRALINLEPTQKQFAEFNAANG